MKHKISGYLSKFTNNSVNPNSIFYQSKNSQKSLNSINNTNSNLTYQNPNNSSQKKSKKYLFKSVYTVYSKNSFGSIPYKTENFLITDKIDNKRFNDVKSIFYFDRLGNPGIGKYNLSKDFTLQNWSMKFGGYNTRFKTSFNEIPGVGDYNIQENKILENNRNNIRYKSLFKKSNSSLKKKLLEINPDINNNNLGPTPTTYTPIYQDDIIRLKKIYNFDSFIGRDKYTGIDMPFSSSKKNYPGPGFYMQNTDLFGSSKNKQLKFSYNEKDISEENSEIEKNPDKTVQKFYNKKDLPNFKLKSRSPKYNDLKIMTFEELQLKNKSEKKRAKTTNKLDELLKNKPNIEKTVDIVSAAIIRNGDVYHIAQEERKKAREEYRRERRERKEREQSLLEEVKSL